MTAFLIKLFDALFLEVGDTVSYNSTRQKEKVLPC